MFLGHFAQVMAAKKVAPKASLGTLVLSAQFADCLWPLLLVLDFEQVRIVPGITRVTPLDLVSYPISHSLLIQLVWGLLLAAIYFFLRKGVRTATVVGARLPTHELLDDFSHRPDLPLHPGGPRVELGIWNSLPLTLMVEFGMFAAGIVLYLTETRSKGGTNYRFWVLRSFPRRNASRLIVRATASQRSGTCLERAGAVADDSVGRLG